MPEDDNKPKRRREDNDPNCILHEERLDDLNTKVSKQSGWLKACAGFLAIVITIGIPVIGSIGSTISNKLNSIETILTDGRIAQTQLNERYISLDRRVTIIETKHSAEEQNVFNGVKR